MRRRRTPFLLLAGVVACTRAATPAATDHALRTVTTSPTADAQDRVLTGTVSRVDGTRAFRLFIPAGVRPSGAPMLVLLHGCLQDAADIARGSRMDEAARRDGFVVLYPEQGAEHNPRRCWNWFDAAHQSRDRGEPALVMAMIDDAVRMHGVARDRVHLAGISAGAAMANLVAVAYPERIASLSLVAGTSWRSAGDVARALAVMKDGAGDGVRSAAEMHAAMGSGARAIPTLILHGDRDVVLNPKNAIEAASQWVGLHDLLARERGGTPLVSRAARRATEQGYAVVEEGWRDQNGKDAVVLVRARELGHAWPGGSSAGTFTDASGPDATAYIERFGVARRDRSP